MISGEARIAPEAVQDSAALQFADAMRIRGLIPPAKMLADGNIHRCDTDDGQAGKGDGAYLLHLDSLPAGGFENHRDGLGWQNWHMRDGRTLSQSEKVAHRQRVSEMQAQRQAERSRRQADAERQAGTLWRIATPCAGHPYLTKKGVRPFGLRVDEDGALLVPMRDSAGALLNVQRIAQDGGKLFLPGGKVAGLYCSIGKPSGVLCIAEGYATAASIHEATGHAVAVALDAGNLKPVAEALRVKLPDIKLIICADADKPQKDGRPGVGIPKATEAARAVGGYLAVPAFDQNRPEGATDFNDLAQHIGVDAVKACIDAAALINPTTVTDDAEQVDPGDNPSQQDDAAEIARLAGLPPIECDRQIKAVAKRLGCRTTTLQAAVKATRRDEQDDVGQGRRLTLPDPDPWPHKVSGSDLLEEITSTVLRYVALSYHAAVAVALWVVHTHAFEASSITPRLAITSPEKRCGKSTLLRLISALVARPLSTASITAPALFRTIEAARPSLMIDEADSFVTGNEDLRGIINAGHARDGAVIRIVGDNMEPREFSCWSPIAIAAIGKLPGTIEDRAIMIAMRRRSADERVERLRIDRLLQFEPITQRCARWVADSSEGLVEADPETPQALNDRAADNWRPLLAIADAAGGAWPALARQASAALNEVTADDDTSARTMLLADIRDMFAERQEDRISSIALAEHLGGLEHRPWPEWRGKLITARQVASLLAPFRISPHSVRIGSATPKGYERKDFEDAFARYLSSEPQHRHSPSNPPVSAQNQSATTSPMLRIEKPMNAKETAACGGVADDFTLMADDGWEGTVE